MAGCGSANTQIVRCSVLPTSYVGHACSRAALFIAVGLCAMVLSAAIRPADAAAYTVVHYCQRTVGPMTKCSEASPRHSYTYNTANGVQGRENAFANKCQKITYWDDEVDVWSRTCATGISVGGRWDDWSGQWMGDNPGYLLRGYVGNNINYGHMYLDGAGAY